MAGFRNADDFLKQLQMLHQQNKQQPHQQHYQPQDAAQLLLTHIMASPLQHQHQQHLQQQQQQQQYQPQQSAQLQLLHFLQQQQQQQHDAQLLLPSIMNIPLQHQEQEQQQQVAQLLFQQHTMVSHQIAQLAQQLVPSLASIKREQNGNLTDHVAPQENVVQQPQDTANPPHIFDPTRIKREISSPNVQLNSTNLPAGGQMMVDQTISNWGGHTGILLEAQRMFFQNQLEIQKQQLTQEFEQQRRSDKDVMFSQYVLTSVLLNLFMKSQEHHPMQLSGLPPMTDPTQQTVLPQAPLSPEDSYSFLWNECVKFRNNLPKL